MSTTTTEVSETITEAMQICVDLLLLAELIGDKRFGAIVTERAVQQLEQADAFLQRFIEAGLSTEAALSTAPSGDGVPGMVRQPDRWPRKGDRMRFLNRNGYDFEREEAAKAMTEGQTFTVKKCDVGSFSHSVQFEEITGSWNGVMFELLSTASTAGQAK